MKLDIKYYPQHEDYSCGPVSLRMVFEHLGRKYSEKKMISLCKALPKTGTSHKRMIDEVKNEGFTFIAGNNKSIADITKFLDAGYPVIVNYFNPLVKKGHYSVVEGYDKDEKVLMLADPANGQDYTLSWNEFNKLWTNYKKTSKHWMLVVGREEVPFT